MKRAFPCRYIKRRIWYLFATECGTFLKQLLICVALLNYKFFASILIHQLENNGPTMHVMKIILIIMLGNACEINNNTDNYTVNTANMVIHKTVLGLPLEVMVSYLWYIELLTV